MLRRAVVYLSLILTASLCSAQDSAENSRKGEPKFLRLVMVVKEVEGNQTINSRSFTAVAMTKDGIFPAVSVRAGSKVPIKNVAGDISYFDVGVSIDYRNIKDLGDALSLDVVTDISSLAGEPVPTLPSVVRQDKWSSTVMVPLRKQTLIFASDDVTSKGRREVELTATPIKP